MLGAPPWTFLTVHIGHSKVSSVARIAYPYDPDDLETRNPPFVQDLITLKLRGYNETITEISKMIAALKEQGNDSGFLKKLKGTPILELKSHARGGQKGGARAYLFEGPDDTFLICRAEWKPDNDANQEMLEDTAYILLAFKNGRPVFPAHVRKRPVTPQEVKRREEKP
jgi:hypothetical protein